MGALLLALLLFAAGWLVGSRGIADVTPRVDTLVVRSVRTDTLIAAVSRRERLVRDTVAIFDRRMDTLTVTVREALPDTLQPVLDSLRAAQDAVAALWRAQAATWREVSDSLRSERDEALALLRGRVRRPFPVQMVVGAAWTAQGLRPALAVGVRVPLPRLF